MAEIKVTKQDLQEAREPDAVLVASRSAFDWLVERRGLAIGVLAAVLVLLGVGSAIKSRSQSKDRDAGAKLSLAVADMTRPVGAESKADEDEEEAPADARRFASKDERAAAVRTQLDDVISLREGSAAARVATLALAQQALDAGKADEALASLQKFVDGGKTFGLEPFAYEAMGYAHEAKGDLTQALAAFEKIGLPARVAYHKARLLQAQGKKEEAREAYKALVAQYPADAVTQEARVRLDLLDVPEAGKGGFEPAAKVDAKPAATATPAAPAPAAAPAKPGAPKAP